MAAKVFPIEEVISDTTEEDHLFAASPGWLDLRSVIVSAAAGGIGVVSQQGNVGNSLAVGKIRIDRVEA